MDFNGATSALSIEGSVSSELPNSMFSDLNSDLISIVFVTMNDFDLQETQIHFLPYSSKEPLGLSRIIWKL